MGLKLVNGEVSSTGVILTTSETTDAPALEDLPGV
jgi:hypothetical protein